MLLTTYSEEIFRPEMNPGFESLHCIGRPDQDISKVIDILKLLPKTNCQQCGELTCRVFAVRVAEGAKGTEKC